MKHKLLTLLILSLTSLAGKAQTAGDSITSDDPRVSDLWFFQLKGNVRHATIRGLQKTDIDFDRNGRITDMQSDLLRVTLHRDNEGRLDSITTVRGRLDDHTTTRYRQRATDERGNWLARKTQRKPYVITTEYCTATYYDEKPLSPNPSPRTGEGEQDGDEK